MVPTHPRPEDASSSQELPPGYLMREVERFDDDVLKGLVARNLSAGSGVMHLSRVHPPERLAWLKARREELHGPRVCLRVGVWFADQLVAWSFCRAESPHALYMMTAGVEPGHRRRGLYTALLRHVEGWALAHGFETLKSSHSASNQPILIAKLREGFVVTGTQLHTSIGLLVTLEKSLYPELEAAFHLRSGWRPMTPAALALFGEE